MDFHTIALTIHQMTRTQLRAVADAAEAVSHGSPDPLAERTAHAVLEILRQSHPDVLHDAV